MEIHKNKKRRKINKLNKKIGKVAVKSCIQSANGLFLQKKYIPEEILIKVLCHLDCKTLLTCQLVCKQWRNLIHQYVWLKKVEETIKHKLLLIDKDISWIAYYFTCSDLPFSKNLLKNHSGEKGPTIYWELPTLKNIIWYREHPAVPSLPDDPIFSELENSCFITSNLITWKYQTVDLIEEGFSPFLLDELQPNIMISELYCCQETPGLYLCDIEFIKSNGEKMLINKDCEGNPISSYTFNEIIKSTEQNKWLKFEHTFKHYGKGLRKIKFIHGGKSHRTVDHQVDIIRHGVKMARASIKVDFPVNNYAIKAI